MSYSKIVHIPFLLGGKHMGLLEIIIVILFLLWVIGLVTSYTLGGAIHLFLVLAIIILIFRLLRRTELTV